MKEFNELLERLTSLDILQKYGEWAENLTDDIWDEHFNGNYKVRQSNLDISTHRWYETSVTVIEIYGGLIGIRHITNLFSESSDYEDCYVKITFHKMKEVKITSYEYA